MTTTADPPTALEAAARVLARRWTGRHVDLTTPATPEEAAFYSSPVLHMECVVEDIVVDCGVLVVVADYGMSLPVREGSTIKALGDREIGVGR